MGVTGEGGHDVSEASSLTGVCDECGASFYWMEGHTCDNILNQANEYEVALAQAIHSADAVISLEKSKVLDNGNYRAYLEPREGSDATYKTIESAVEKSLKDAGYTETTDEDTTISKTFRSFKGTGLYYVTFHDEIDFNVVHQYVTYLYNQQ